MAFRTYTPSKSQQVRAIAARMQERGELPRPKTIREELLKHGVICDAAQISRVLRKFTGKRLRKRRCNVAAKVAAERTQRAETQATFTQAELTETAKFVRQCGGVAKAIRRLNSLAEFFGAFGTDKPGA